MTGRAAKWIACTGGVALVAGATVFLSVQTLDDADRWSSVGAFLTALVTVVGSVAAWVFRRDSPTTSPAADSPPKRRGWTAVNWGNQVVINGDNTDNRIEYRKAD